MDFVKAVSTFFCRRRVEAVAATAVFDANVVVKAAGEVMQAATLAEPVRGPLSWMVEDAKASAEALEAGSQLLAGIASDIERLSSETVPATVPVTVSGTASACAPACTTA